MNLDVFSTKSKLTTDYYNRIALLNLYKELTLPDHVVIVNMEREIYTYDGPEGDEYKTEKVGTYTSDLLKQILIKAIEDYFNG